MKTVYVTYQKDGLVKKGVITEEKYKQLSSDSTVNDLMIYPNELLMEQNFQVKTTGNTNNKSILHG